jgi:hypothetical protein
VQYHQQQQRYLQQQAAQAAALQPFPPSGLPGMSGQFVPVQAQQAQQLLGCQASQQQQQAHAWHPANSGLVGHLSAGQPVATAQLGFAGASGRAPLPGPAGATVADALWQAASLPGGESTAMTGTADLLPGHPQP